MAYTIQQCKADVVRETAGNNHIEALCCIARYKASGNPSRLVRALEAVQILQNYFGELTPALREIRGPLSVALFDSLDPMEKSALYNHL